MSEALMHRDASMNHSMKDYQEIILKCVKIKAKKTSINN